MENDIIWSEVVDFFSKKYFLTRAAFSGSEANINGNTLNVNLKTKSKVMLEQKSIDKTVSDFIANTRGVRYNVNFIDPINSAETNENKQNDIVKKMLEENAKRAAEIQSQSTKQQPDNNASSPARPLQGNEKVNGMGFVPKNNGENSAPNRSSKKVSMTHVENQEKLIYKGWKSTNDPKEIKIINLTPDVNEVIIRGKVSNYDSRETKNGGFLVSFDIYDGSSSISVKAFLKKNEFEEVNPKLKGAKAVRIVGTYEFNTYGKEYNVIADTIEETEIVEKSRMDNSEEKRVELHLHTQMSQMDAVSSAEDLIKRAIMWGHKAIAITDHGVVQAFPDANKAVKGAVKKAQEKAQKKVEEEYNTRLNDESLSNEEKENLQKERDEAIDKAKSDAKKKNDIKILYGVEAYLVPDRLTSVNNPHEDTLKDATYCVLDIETTGLSKQTDKITEFGIMKVKDGEVIDTFECFVNPERPIPEKVVEVTHITDEMVKDAETIDVVLPKVLDFVKDSIIVAHNADFDVGFIKYNAEQLGYELPNTYIDTLAMAKALFPDFKKYKLGLIAEKLDIKVEVAHRALADVETLVAVFNVMLKMLDEKEVKKISEIDDKLSEGVNFKNLPTHHAIILAKNKVGLKNLYKLISFSHLNYFYKKPKVLKSIYKKYSDGLIIGSACEQGELYQAILNKKPEDEIESIADFYDYLEIQPIGNNNFMVREGIVASDEDLRDINRQIVALGEKLSKPVVATCDVHFMDPEDEVYRRILQAGQGYEDADNQPELFLRTTDEMLEEFKYLGEEKAHEVVITNTNMIADMCEKICPIADYKATPHIDGCEQTIRDITMKRAVELYGDPLPEIVQQRIDKELDSIIKNGFSVMYIIAQKLVTKSNEDGYLVGSRGSVGSSFVANMTGITEVNSLPPHYRCPNCKYSDFSDYGVKNGFDLPDMDCPKCGHKLAKDGMDIPFETFLGFDGDKEPDIDLNFSGEYQAKAHRYTEVIFGKGTTFKAGTIGTIADKTAYGYVKKYYEDRNKMVGNAETLRLAAGCTGVKRTTGQHPGGIIVVPMGNEIYEFCPVQHPADDPNSDIITTHFDYHSIDQNLLKLDILGHDDPTMIRMLQDLTGVNPQEIPLDDKETMSIFSSTKALGVTPEQINSEVGTFGVPEFGTKFVRGMLVDTMPTKFEELLRISGLSHGTDVWLNNAQTLIQSGTIKLEEAICTRDDIMLYLIKQGLPPKPSFKIMESVRKGKGLTEEQESMMKEYSVPEWYIDSCKKIKYMFPKAHAAAYVTMAFRIAWFKVHIPEAYYTAFFSIRADEFDSDIMIHGKQKVIEKMREIDMQGNDATTKDKNMYSVLEIVLEMYERGLHFLPIDIYESDATKFKIEKDGIRPPLNSIPGLGNVAAIGIQAAREKEGKFMSIEEMKIRAGVGKSVIELLRNSGCLNGMQESNQMTLFAM